MNQLLVPDIPPSAALPQMFVPHVVSETVWRMTVLVENKLEANRLTETERKMFEAVYDVGWNIVKIQTSLKHGLF